jgi:hypothetical protein
MKCQECDQPATHHVTEIVAGEPVEYHVCDSHLDQLDTLKPGSLPGKPATGFGTFFADPDLRQALEDPAVRQRIAAHMLPALCLALLDQKAEVRIAAAFHLMLLGCRAVTAAGALRDALQDPDPRVARAAKAALESVESEEETVPWLMWWFHDKDYGVPTCGRILHEA